jgi:Na+-transporting methylmalonyl-CoA/oxaloacetate decarboxylase gamma subunit
MTILEMLKQSAILTLLGMTIVFVFLWVMIGCVSMAGRLTHRFDSNDRVIRKHQVSK